MPKKEERELDVRADRMGLRGDRKDAYVWGTMNKIKKARKAKRARKGRK